MCNIIICIISVAVRTTGSIYLRFFSLVLDRQSRVGPLDQTVNRGLKNFHSTQFSNRQKGTEKYPFKMMLSCY